MLQSVKAPLRKGSFSLGQTFFRRTVAAQREKTVNKLLIIEYFSNGIIVNFLILFEKNNKALQDLFIFKTIITGF
jgi:hypothetical protein